MYLNQALSDTHESFLHDPSLTPATILTKLKQKFGYYNNNPSESDAVDSIKECLDTVSMPLTDTYETLDHSFGRFVTAINAYQAQANSIKEDSIKESDKLLTLKKNSGILSGYIFFLTLTHPNITYNKVVDMNYTLIRSSKAKVEMILRQYPVTKPNLAAVTGLTPTVKHPPVIQQSPVSANQARPPLTSWSQKVCPF